MRRASRSRGFVTVLAFQCGYFCGRKIITWRMAADQVAIIFGIATVLAIIVGISMLAMERIFIGSCQ